MANKETIELDNLAETSSYKKGIFDKKIVSSKDPLGKSNDDNSIIEISSIIFIEDLTYNKRKVEDFYKRLETKFYEKFDT